MPEAMSFEQAGGLTYSFHGDAVPARRGEARTGADDPDQWCVRSIGTVAIQLARKMGAHVIAVCSAQ